MDWDKIGFLTGSGTTTERINYTFIDKNVSPGSYYYRLKQIDFDGTAEYSPTINVIINTEKSYYLSQNYPNPFNASTNIEFYLPKRAQVKLTIYDVMGKEIHILVNNEFDSEKKAK